MFTFPVDGCTKLWNTQREAIVWLFHGLCIVCQGPYDEINEIVPRARLPHGKALEWPNQVPLCTKHHREYHHGGVTEEKIKEMKELRVQRLEEFGREKYA